MSGSDLREHSGYISLRNVGVAKERTSATGLERDQDDLRRFAVGDGVEGLVTFGLVH